MDKYSKMNIKSKILQNRTNPKPYCFGFFFGYKNKKSLSTDICNKSTGFFLILCYCFYGKLQNINPIKVDKTTIINLEKGSYHHRY
jgi:hypothetical protein